MNKILVLYYSRHGSTKNLADHIALGIESTGCEAVLRTVAEVSPVNEQTNPTIPEKGDIYATKSDVMDCQGLILGSPTRFGNMASPLKYFIDTWSDIWLKGTLVDKPAAVFTSSSSMHGGQESTLLTMMLPLLHHGMIIVGLPYTEQSLHTTEQGGSPYGASHVTGSEQNTLLNDDEKRLAFALGQRIAKISMQLSH